MRWQVFKLHLMFTLSTTSHDNFLHICWWRRYFFFRIWSHFCFLCDCVATSSPSSPLHNGSLPATSSDWPVSGYSSSFSLSFSDGDSSGTHLQYPPLLCGPAETPLIQIGALTKHFSLPTYPLPYLTCRRPSYSLSHLSCSLLCALKLPYWYTFNCLFLFD